MPLPKPAKGERMADFLGKFMGNPTAVKDYPDTKQRYAVGASIFKNRKKHRRMSAQLEESSILVPNEGESFAEYLERFVSNEKMKAMFPDEGDRAEVASELYEDMEEGSEGESEGEYTESEDSGEDAEAGSSVEPIAPALEEGGEVDDIDETGLSIRGVSVLTVGRAKGHNLEIDDTTLSQVLKCANSYKGGVKVNENHGAGIGDIVGKLNNFRIDPNGEKLIADLTFLKSRKDRAKYYIDLAKEIPDSFGISISFSGESEQTGTGIDLARCSELYSADLVQHPASNPTGLFSVESGCVTVDKKEMINMENQESKPEAKAEYNMEDFAKRMGAMEDRLKKLEEAMTPSDVSEKEQKTGIIDTNMAEPPAPTMKEEQKREDKAATEGALSAQTAKTELSSVLKEIRTELSKIVSAPVAPSAPAVEEKKPQTFSELVNFEMKQGNISKAEALRLCVGKYNEIYRKELSAGGIKVL